MYRVAFCVGFAAFAGGCAAGSMPLSSGFADAPPVSRSYKKPDVALGADVSVPRGPNLGGSAHDPLAAGKSQTSNSNAKLASLGADNAPKGTFERAPAGSLSDRDYSKTSLDPSFARDMVNQYRATHGLKPLKLSAELTAAAKVHSRDLAKWDRISHYGSDGSNPWDRVKRAGFKARVAAENVGTGQTDFAEVMKGWKDSPGHNKNLLLADADYMGVALVQEPKSEFKSFWTLVIGSPM